MFLPIPTLQVILTILPILTFSVVQKIEKYDVSKIFEMQRKPEEMVDEGGGDKEVWVVNGNTKEAYTDLGIFYR